MDDDYDIYGDLEGFEVETRKETQIVKELNAEIEELKAKIAEKETEKEVITKQNGILLENISSLLLTAKAEIKRKDSLIADIRRQRDDNAFRRNPRSVRKHDKGTQTTLIRMLNQSAQTESVGTMTEKKVDRDRGRDRNRRRSRSTSRDGRRESENSRNRDRIARNDLRDMIRKKHKLKEALMIENRRERRAMQLKIREKDRERDQRARHRENRSPDLSPVEFPCLRRKSMEEVAKADSVAETKLKETFIPMNKRELDRYVKEMARTDKRSPDADTLQAVSNSDLWDRQLAKKPQRTRSRENCVIKDKHSESNDHATTTDEAASNSDLWVAPSEGKTLQKKRRTSKLVVEDHIIQSDEIGTTGVGASLSPEKMEDVEQRMRALHGESTPSANHEPECMQTSTELIEGLNRSSGALDTSQPPALVIPPQEPPIIELVPELSFEDDLRLNDSRELRIVESEDTAPDQEDERNSSAETVIAKQPLENEEKDLEEGELLSSDESQPAQGDLKRSQPAVPERVKATTSRSKLQTTTQKTTKRRDSKAQILLDRLSNSFIRGHVQSSHHRSEDSKSSKHETKANSKSDRHIEYFETSTPNRTTRRKSQRLNSSHEVKEESKSSQSKTIHPVSADPVDEKAHGKTRKESLKDLFGTDDENSLFGSPDKVSAKRRHSATRDKSDDRKKQKVDSAAHEERAFKDNVSTKRRSKSKTRDKVGVPAEGFPKKEKSNSELNVPIVVDSSSEEAPMPSVQLVQPIHKKAAKKTRTEKCQTSELEATVKTIPEVNDKAKRATSKRSSKEIIIDLSAEEELPKNTTIQKLVAESINAENSLVPDLTDKSKHFPTDQRVCGDQSSLQNPTPMDVSSSSVRLQPDEPNALLEESFADFHVIENIKSTLFNESSQEIQPDKKLVESHQPTKETPEIYEESSRAQLQTVEQEQDESQRSLITSRRAETGVTEVQELQEGLPFDYSNQRSDTQIIKERPALSPQLQAAPISSTERHQHDQQNVLSEGSQEIETFVAAKVAAEGPEDLSSKSSQIDRQEPKASKDQRIVDVPSYESERSSTVTECTDVPACPPNELEHASQTSLPETPQAVPSPEKVTPSDPSESQQRQTPQVIVYSNKYGEYRIEDNNESEITIYVTRKKRRSRKSLPASTEVSSSSIVVE